MIMKPTTSLLDFTLFLSTHAQIDNICPLGYTSSVPSVATSNTLPRPTSSSSIITTPTSIVVTSFTSTPGPVPTSSAPGDSGLQARQVDDSEVPSGCVPVGVQCPPGYTFSPVSSVEFTSSRGPTTRPLPSYTVTLSSSIVPTSFDGPIPTPSTVLTSSEADFPSSLSVPGESGSLEARQEEEEVPSGCVRVEEETGRPDDGEGEEEESDGSEEEGAAVRLTGLGLGGVILVLGVGMVL